MYSFSKLHWYEKAHLGKQNHTKNNWNIKCSWQSVLWPNHTLARCVFFYQYCLREIDTLYMCHSNFIVFLRHISGDTILVTFSVTGGTTCEPHLGKVCIFLPILFKGKLMHYICVIPILLCCYHTFKFHLGLKFELKHSL